MHFKLKEASLHSLIKQTKNTYFSLLFFWLLKSRINKILHFCQICKIQHLRYFPQDRKQKLYNCLFRVVWQAHEKLETIMSDLLGLVVIPHLNGRQRAKCRPTGTSFLPRMIYNALFTDYGQKSYMLLEKFRHILFFLFNNNQVESIIKNPRKFFPILRHCLPVRRWLCDFWVNLKIIMS